MVVSIATIIGLVASVFIFKDRIINEFIREANKSLNTPIKIGKIDISPFVDFPNMAIVFHDVYIEDSHPGESPLATAQTISFFLNPVEVWRGRYSIRGLQISDSETFLKINAAGKSNYVILKSPPKDAKPGSITLNLKNVILKNTKVSYKDLQLKQDHVFESESLVASLLVDKEVYHITSQGDITVKHIGVKKTRFLEDKTFDIKSTLHYNNELKSILIDPSLLQLGSSEFEVKGEYFFKDLGFINVKASGKQTTIQTLLALMPETSVSTLKKYESEGEVYFDLSLKGEWSEEKVPLFSVSFGCRNATVLYPPTQTKIKNANLEGSYASTSAANLAHGELFLKNITGDLNGKSFKGNLTVQNFDNPYVEFDFTGKLDAESVNSFYPIKEISNLSGEFDAAISFAGQLELLKEKATAQKIKANGSIELQNINFTYGPRNVSFNNLNGTLQFTNNDLALSNVKGQLGKSDFLLNGFFKNIITFLLFEDQPIGIETDLKSNFIDLDELFRFGFGEQQSSDYSFTISPNIHLNFNCNVNSLRYKRFQPRKIKGDLLVKNQMAVSRNISLQGMGGGIDINGILDAKNPKAIDFVGSFKLDGVNTDSVFYVFENFYQDFIQDKHLKGKVFAEVSMEMTLNEKLYLKPESLIADIGATIKNGELNEFEPLEKLNRYLDDEGLNHLRFADLKNEIHIENKTIYIPLMEIKSNVTTIQLSGTHTFDQKIDYRVIAPLRSKKKIDPDEAFGAIEETTTGKPKLYLKITGTTDDYSISYDAGAVKKKISGDLKKEVQELKDAFKTKGKKKKKELELEKDDYFDWDNQP